MTERDNLVEQLADVQHGIWAHWMLYLFGVSEKNADGSVTIPAEKVQRWHRQMNAGFADLPENEQRSDYGMAERVMLAIKPLLSEVQVLRAWRYSAPLDDISLITNEGIDDYWLSNNISVVRNVAAWLDKVTP